MVTNGEWQQYALCAQTEPEIFFPETNTSFRAYRVCNMCEVQRECLEEALAESYQYGIRGGLPASARVKIRSEMRAQNAESTSIFDRIGAQINTAPSSRLRDYPRPDQQPYMEATS